MGPSDQVTFEARRTGLVRDAERALADGDADAALALLERAASLAHSADTEMALVRTLMQQGKYGSAMNFCAHVAGAHAEAPASAALYAWLLDLGGQPVQARRVLTEALQRAPNELVLEATLHALPTAEAHGVMLTLPHRMAPFGSALESTTEPRVVGTAALIDAGRRALAPLASLTPAGTGRLWLRNGLGAGTAATVEHRLPALGLAVLALQTPLAWPAAYGGRAGNPFAGSPGYAIAYRVSAAAEPAWPRLSPGFFRRAVDMRTGGSVGVGFDLPVAATSAVVLDSSARLAGIALAPSDSADGAGDGIAPRWVALTAIQAELDRFGIRIGAGADEAPPSSAQHAYERGMRAALQLIVAVPAEANSRHLTEQRLRE